MIRTDRLSDLRTFTRRFDRPASILPSWLRPSALVGALLLHATILVVATGSPDPYSPFDGIEVTIATLGDNAEDKPEREEIKPGSTQAATPEPTNQPAALAAPVVAEPQAPALPVRTNAPADQPAKNELTRKEPAKNDASSAFEIPPSASQLAQRSGATAGSKQATSLSRASYEGLLIAEFSRHKFYPAAARVAGITGSVEVSFTVGADGHITNGTITRSSGNALLDAQARAMMEAVSAPPPPGGQFRSSTTIRFSLY
jgi:protein TonB